ncbi:MAG TPA: LytTR family DNA-binding domain-containing protein [Cytophagaceae bacterium]|jgi:DNA-binding LytR/AlgR family response regulator|nr:LytTR family DNA-binding domain-containing protein [Cytophagaceae bacterium]
MKKISCLIVDDEPLALDLIERYVMQTPFMELKGRCHSPLEAMSIMGEESIDLLFLDIQMLDMTGIEFSRTLKNGPKFIFTTAFEKYALEGFRVDALDYLLKPFSYEEFLKSAGKAKEWFDRADVVRESEEIRSPYIFVKSEYKLIRINLADILYIEGLKDYVKIYLHDKPAPVLSLMSMKAIEEQLPVFDFMRIHRSFIINLSKIESVERGKVKIKDMYMPVADNYKQRFQEFINKSSF